MKWGIQDYLAKIKYYLRPANNINRIYDKMDKHIGGKRLFHETEHVEDNHLQDLINALIILMNEIIHTFYETYD